MALYLSTVLVTMILTKTEPERTGRTPGPSSTCSKLQCETEEHTEHRYTSASRALWQPERTRLKGGQGSSYLKENNDSGQKAEFQPPLAALRAGPIRRLSLLRLPLR